MIWMFIKERASWIIFFLTIQVLLVLYSVIDQHVELSSVLYFIYLTTILFIVFLLFRYFKEINFYKQLQDRSEILDTSDIAEPRTQLERIVYDQFSEQTDYYRKLSTQQQVKLEQEKDDLLSWIHEIKTPLTAMQLIIDRIEDKAIQSDLQYEWLRIHYLLDQQLHQKRMLVIENDLHMESVDIQQLLHQEIRTLRSWCLHQGVGFELDLRCPTVITDKKWTSFIIRQILSNAVKYSKQSDIMIESYETSKHTVISIKDEGIGIAKKDIPRIFDKGFTSTYDHQSGKTSSATGMGLYLAKQAADTLHITLSVESEVNKGTTVTLHFPKKNTFTQIREQTSSM